APPTTPQANEATVAGTPAPTADEPAKDPASTPETPITDATQEKPADG
nr:hypothetical protein [Solirubrobacterales bacterium]